MNEEGVIPCDSEILGRLSAKYAGTDKAGVSYQLEITSDNPYKGAMEGELIIDNKKYVLQGSFRFKYSGTDVEFSGYNYGDHNFRAGYFFLKPATIRN
jgi:hypothetical protein